MGIIENICHCVTCTKGTHQNDLQEPPLFRDNLGMREGSGLVACYRKSSSIFVCFSESLFAFTWPCPSWHGSAVLCGMVPYWRWRETQRPIAEWVYTCRWHRYPEQNYVLNIHTSNNWINFLVLVVGNGLMVWWALRIVCQGRNYWRRWQCIWITFLRFHQWSFWVFVCSIESNRWTTVQVPG